MAWVPITTGSLKLVLSDAEYNKFTTTLTGSMNAADIVSNQITAVTNLVRGYIGAAYKNDVSTDPTLIPDSLLFPALSILSVWVSARLGGFMVDSSGVRKTEYDRAWNILNDVKEGRFATEKPTNPQVPYAEKDTVILGSLNPPLCY